MDHNGLIPEARCLLSQVKYRDDMRSPAIVSAMKSFVTEAQKLNNCFKNEADPRSLTVQISRIRYRLSDLNGVKEQLEALRPGTTITAIGNQATRSGQINAPMGPLGQGRVNVTAKYNIAEDSFQHNAPINADSNAVRDIALAWAPKTVYSNDAMETGHPLGLLASSG
ncbi:hypothetical protein ANO14919_126140 [Xylariales sp. No.14919]|nr:hypothetical protein ANO14919_126140 [Xylariales sp. No.14919]